jgi:hypothetical protein
LGRAARAALGVRGADEHGGFPRAVRGREDGGQGLKCVDDHGSLSGGFGCLYAAAQQLLGADELLVVTCPLAQQVQSPPGAALVAEPPHDRHAFLKQLHRAVPVAAQPREPSEAEQRVRALVVAASGLAEGEALDQPPWTS